MFIPFLLHSSSYKPKCHEVQSPMSPFNLADLFSPRIWSSWIIWTLFRSTKNLSYHPGTFQIIWKLFGSSGHLSYHQDIFLTIWTLHFSGHLDRHDAFHIIKTLFGSSGDFADHSNSFLTSGHFPDSTKQDSQQNLSGLALLTYWFF